ncbi:hypothetical protein SANTM175S_01080 [Streptomyces antimycoticus]
MELQALDALGGDDVRGALEGDPDEADLHALVLPHGVGLEDGLAGLLVGDVRGEVGEVGAREGLALLVAALLGVAPAVLHPAQLGAALVEFMVADRGDVEVQLVERLDGRLVVEETGQQRAGADHVAAGGGDGVVVALTGVTEGGGQVFGATRRDGLGGAVRLGLGDGAGGALRGLQVSVQVVEGQQLYVDGAPGPVLVRGGGGVRARRARGGQHPGRGGQHRDSRGQPACRPAPLRSRWHVVPLVCPCVSVMDVERSLRSTRVAGQGWEVKS